MKRRVLITFLFAAAVALTVALVLAQRGRGGFYGGEPDPYGGRVRDRGGVPDWENDAEFEEDVFTFVRVVYTSQRWGSRHGGGWSVDWPASDLNFSYRLQELTSMKVNPETRYLTLTDPELFDYPFLYLVEPGALVFSEQEVKALRRYLDNGGFLMVDDFWGEEEWNNFYQEIRRVFPDRRPADIV